MQQPFVCCKNTVRSCWNNKQRHIIKRVLHWKIRALSLSAGCFFYILGHLVHEQHTKRQPIYPSSAIWNMTLILNLSDAAALQLLRLICWRLPWSQWSWKSILIRYDASRCMCAEIGQAFRSGLTDCDGDHTLLIGCTAALCMRPTHAQLLRRAL